MNFIIYYRMFGGIDAKIRFGSLEAMQRELKLHKPEDFDYINACTINPEDKSEEIVFSSVKEIMEAKSVSMNDDKFLETIVTQAILDQVKPTWLDKIGNYIGMAIVLAIPILALIGKYYGA